MSDLAALAERVEQAEGPSRELDALIAASRLRLDGTRFASIQAWVDEAIAERWNFDRYTASLDAAMTLVPKGYRLASFGEEAFDDEPKPWVATLSARAGRFGAMGKRGRAATPALALVAAALRAKGSHNHDD